MKNKELFLPSAADKVLKHAEDWKWHNSKRIINLFKKTNSNMQALLEVYKDELSHFYTAAALNLKIQ